MGPSPSKRGAIFASRSRVVTSEMPSPPLKDLFVNAQNRSPWSWWHFLLWIQPCGAALTDSELVSLTCAAGGRLGTGQICDFHHGKIRRGGTDERGRPGVDTSSACGQN